MKEYSNCLTVWTFFVSLGTSVLKRPVAPSFMMANMSGTALWRTFFNRLEEGEATPTVPLPESSQVDLNLHAYLYFIYKVNSMKLTLLNSFNYLFVGTNVLYFIMVYFWMVMLFSYMNIKQIYMSLLIKSIDVVLSCNIAQWYKHPIGIWSV